MHVKQELVVKGAGFFTGEIEGVNHNTGQIFVEEEFDKSKPNYKGFRTVEYKCLDSDVVKPLMHLEFPITAEVEMEIAATKRGQTIIVNKVKPLSLAKGMPKPSPASA
jgi:hypothetical protein